VAKQLPALPPDPNIVYGVKCERCLRRSPEGTKAEVQAWIGERCTNPNGTPSPENRTHAAHLWPLYRNDGSFKCGNCSKPYARFVGDASTTTQCSDCVRRGRELKSGKGSAVGGLLPCGAGVSFMSGDGFGGFTGHHRKKFVMGGEGWACCIPRTAYDTLSGSSSSPCGKRAQVHVTMPENMRLPGATRTEGRCGMVCDKHAAMLIGQGATGTAAR
jgi:hypothetical protein